ncbi:unnamed protein product [Rotaria magnacalcarata]|uniref:HAT C-terminal dimerisation domain-containing protein n=3 Tax=Rotaria magnacalcarata TaxID=392030 RepID=A0A816WDX4_9BILA|nr:unnamed protein product [Rotaria magnacalcarata]
MSTSNKYTVDKIKYRLQHDKANYEVAENDASRFKSKCWNIFGFPTKKNKAGRFERINGFVSCQKCYQTFAYTPTTGTRHLNAHTCVLNFLTNSTTSAPTTVQTTLDNIPKNLKQIKLSDSEQNKCKDLMAKWIFADMRPFTITEDKGLRIIFQELISLGAKHGDFDVKNVVRGADVISDHVGSLADKYRTELREILKEPFENEAMCISPDMWSDPHKQLSYLGLSCSFVDANLNYKSVDLCCRPYYEVDQSGDNLLVCIQKVLESYGINDLTQLNFVSDRGPNLVKALKPYRPIYCYAHRLNNVLKRLFFQSQKKKKKNEEQNAQLSTINLGKNENEDSDLSTSSSEDENALSLPVRTNKKKTKAGGKSALNDPGKLELSDLDSSAQEVIKTIVNCKKLVQYVKKAGINKDIQSAGGIALQQSTVVRWLSMIDLLESILRSYKQTKRILLNRKQQSKIIVIDERIVEELIQLLKPFKYALKLIQSGSGPSLYMVLICTLYLRRTLTSFKNLISVEPLLGNVGQDKENASDNETEEIVESEGVKILRERTLELLNLMFELDIRHYASTMLHPKYRQLKGCSKQEKDQTCKYIREEMIKIIRKDKSFTSIITEPIVKKQKTEKSILERFEDDSEYDFDLSDKQDDSFTSVDYDYKSPKPDELTKYLDMYIDKTTISQNPLDFWRLNQSPFPILTKLARKLHCIPATSAAVERQFSGAGFVLNERRTCIDPDNVDNILLIRSVEKYK